LDPEGLKDNGGPTQTIALLPSSPAIDAGANPLALPTDQRGLPRTLGSGTDIGAFELVTPPPIALSSVHKSEGDSGAKPFTFTVTRGGDTTVAFTLNWTLALGNGPTFADANDFVNGVVPTGSITFNPGETSQSITVNVQGDSLVEEHETFSLILFDVASGIVLASANGTIFNDDVELVNGIPANSGRDILTGTGLTDVLTGGPGADLITTGAGDDVLIYTTLRDAGDRITDFSPGSDRFDLSSLFQSLSLGSLDYDAATSGGYLKFQASGANTILQIDADGVGPGRTVNFLTVENLAIASLNNSANFIL
jgi:Ca2+-binding RTX toxin-like protein